MAGDSDAAEELIRRLPLPLAKLYRHATNAKSSLERHQAAYFLFEAGLKLLAVSAVASYAAQRTDDPQITKQLETLSRPSLGEWRKYVRLLVPLLAADPGFAAIKQMLERSRDDLPRAAGLDAVLREVTEKKFGARSTVRLNELFDRLVTYRNLELGHGASGLRVEAFYGRMERSLLAGIPEILGRLDVLAGRRLIYIADVTLRPSGNWLVERFELIGEMPRRLEPLELQPTEAGRSLAPGRVYLEGNDAQQQTAAANTPLYPLVIFDSKANELLFLNAQRGKLRCDYLCYSSGEVQQNDELGGQMGDLSTRIFGKPADSQQAAPSTVPPPRAEEKTAAPDEHAPLETIGEFELISKLGQGGMGIVYRAWQPSVGRQVALKCLLRTGDAKSAERFAREYRALGRVDDPHLVKVYTSGSEGDQWFYAMELIEGATLAPVCKRLQAQAASAADVAPDTWKEAVTTSCEETRRAEQPLSKPGASHDNFGSPPEEAAAASQMATPPLEVQSYVPHVVELIRQVATAADKLHKAGVVHRDIKPGNIMLTADGSHAVLMDLGLAQWTDNDQFTSTRQFVGTLRYASPEQVLAVDRLDGRSDVYSLGATLWELLTLRPMFAATDETPTPELMKRIQYEEAQPVSKFNPSIARDLEAVVSKCLEKNPDHRYASAADLADDLGRWLRNEPVQAQALDWRYRTSKFIRRNRRRIAVGSVVGLLQIALIAGLYHLFARSTPVAPSNGSPAVVGAQPVVPPARRRALLVGCTKYDNLPEGQLAGSLNDVIMLRDTLKSKFGLTDDNVVVLSEAGGSEQRPTRANIAREIAKLATTAKVDDQVVVFLAGNATAAPAKKIARGGHAGSPFRFTGLEVHNDEKSSPTRPSDGLEHYFFPADVGRPEPGGNIPNSVSGSEFAGWIQPILAAGGRVWLIYDCCDGGFAAPASPTPGNAAPPVAAKSREFVATYASQPNEETVEARLPAGSVEAVPHGLFTYTLCEILIRSARPLTYNELVERVIARYQAEGRTQPTPWAAGAAASEPVLGGVDFAAALNFRVRRVDGDTYTIDGGAIHGLTKGCILEVKSPTDKKQTLGHLRVVSVSELESTAVPFEFEGVSGGRGQLIPVGAPAQLTYVDLGDQRLKVAIVEKTRAGETLPADALDQLEGAVDRVVRHRESLVSLVSNAEQADWIVVQESLVSRDIYLARPEAAIVVSKPGEKKPPPGVGSGAFGPIPRGQLAKLLPDMLSGLARAGNLLTVARLSDGEFARGRAKFDVDLEMLRFKDAADKVGTPLVRRGDVPVARAGDQIGWRVRNRSAEPVDVTLLYIDSDSDIVSIFPRLGSRADNRLAPNQSLLMGRAKVDAKTTGIEHVILLTAPGRGEPIDFSVLENHTLELARAATRGASDPTFDTAMGRIFQNALYGEGKQEGKRQGLTVQEIDEFPIRALSWRVMPTDR
jgi:serine/threonine protein kinase